VEVVTLVRLTLDGARITACRWGIWMRPGGIGQFNRGAWVGLRSAPRMLLSPPVLEPFCTTSGSAGVIGLADPVELPYWNKTELCHTCHVTLAPFSFPLDRCPSLYQHVPPGRGLLLL
jgi:hypothetical protein